MPTSASEFIEIADKCPVHRTLTSEIRIVTRRRGLTNSGARPSHPLEGAAMPAVARIDPKTVFSRRRNGSG